MTRDFGALDAVTKRRSNLKMTASQPTQAQISSLIEAAVRAPNHYRNEPWRFIVLAGEARERLGAVCAECASARIPDGPAKEKLVEAERGKPLRSPVLIVVARVKTEHPKAMRVEDLAATAAAVQNLLIAAHAHGLAAAWKTGDSAYDEHVKQALGLDAADDIVAFVHVGHPDPAIPETPLSARSPIDAVTRWDGWEADGTAS